jgi:tRNA A37 threonylcarbamoyltransferase TsaD
MGHLVQNRWLWLIHTLVSVNHMQAHILAHFIDEEFEKPSFPFLALTISGGHTQISSK